MSESTGTRMAGDKLAQRERNAAARAKIGNDPDKLAARLSGVDREKYDFSGYSGQQINEAFRGGTFDATDYARLTGNTPKAEETPEVVEETPAVAEEPVAEVEKTPEVNIDFGNDGGGNPDFVPDMREPGSGFQNIFQDNDINSAVVGDNNTVTNDQDNSIRSYAGRTNDWKKGWMDKYFS